MKIIAMIATLAISAVQTQALTSRLRHGDQKTVTAITSVLDAQVAAWNQGDIEGFMHGYWESPETIFVSGDNVMRGWQNVLDRYKKSYDSREKMGTLAFTDLEITSIGKGLAVALGRWKLTRAADTPHGRFTLILRLTPQGWRIIHDHTSSAA
jgi:ketosteroid isomerase-like protein